MRPCWNRYFASIPVEPVRSAPFSRLSDMSDSPSAAVNTGSPQLKRPAPAVLIAHRLTRPRSGACPFFHLPKAIPRSDEAINFSGDGRIAKNIGMICRIQTTSRTLWEEVTFDRNNVTSVDWKTYPISEIATTPDSVEIVLINRPDKPSAAPEKRPAGPWPARSPMRCSTPPAHGSDARR